MIAIILLFALACFAPTFIPLISALDNDEKRTAAVIGVASLVAHVSFWCWAFQQDLKGSTLSAGLGWYVASSVIVPVAALPVIKAVRKRALRTAIGVGLAGVAIPTVFIVCLMFVDPRWAGAGLLFGMPLLLYLVCRISINVVATAKDNRDH
jgi:hypothetical protein